MYISWHNKGIPQECGQNIQNSRYTVYKVPLTTVSGHAMRFCRKVYIPGVPRETFGQSLGFKLVGIKCDVTRFRRC